MGEMFQDEQPNFDLISSLKRKGKVRWPPIMKESLSFHLS